MFSSIINRVAQAKIKWWGGIKLNGWNNHIESLNIHRSAQGIIVIKEGFSIRKGAILNVSDCGKLFIGENVFINNGTKINARDSISIGSECIIGQDVLLYDHDHDYRSENRRTEFKTSPITIGENVWIGSQAIILKGVHIGDNSVIAAGTVVSKDVPPNVLYYRKLGEEVCKPINGA